MDEKSGRRWFAFTLRTLLIVVVPISAGLAWTAHSLNWIKQRHDALLAETNDFWRVRYLSTPMPMELRPYHPCTAPGWLWLFGEDGASELHWAHEESGAPSLEEVQRLFPEAKVIPVTLIKAT